MLFHYFINIMVSLIQLITSLMVIWCILQNSINSSGMSYNVDLILIVYATTILKHVFIYISILFATLCQYKDCVYLFYLFMIEQHY